ncbi:MAG: tetratricopeptide repeat protein [Bacteroides sp.]
MMSRISLVAAALALGLSAVLVGCDNPEKMKDIPKEALPKMDPNPLVLVGKTVEGKIKGTFPPKYFNKNAKLELTPVLKYEGRELVLPSKVFQGEKVTENNTVINSDLGGVYSHDFKFEYKPEMMKSTMELRMTLYYKDKKVPFGLDYKLGEGVNETQNLVDLLAAPAWMPHNYVRTRDEQRNALFKYDINRAEIASKEYTEDDIKEFQKALKELNADDRAKLQGFSVKAYASPDGPVALNDNLSKGRGRSSKNWLQEQIIKNKLKVEVDAISLDAAIDWEGFKKSLEESSIEDRDMMLRVLAMSSDPDVRNREMHSLSKIFKEVAVKILPDLRRSEMVANYKFEGRSGEEILKEVANGKLLELPENEAYYAAELEKDMSKRESMYKELAGKYNNLRGYNNLACIYLLQGKFADAREQLDKAQALDNKNPFVLNNLGVLAMVDGNAEEAEKYFVRATEAGPAVRANLGACAILRGQYQAAVDYLTGTGIFNHGLALMLTDRNEAAKNVFTDLKTAKAYYGLAILGARTQDEKMLLDNLRTAIQMDASFKARAAKDVEFIKFIHNDVFASLLK